MWSLGGRGFGDSLALFSRLDYNRAASIPVGSHVPLIFGTAFILFLVIVPVFLGFYLSWVSSVGPLTCIPITLGRFAFYPVCLSVLRCSECSIPSRLHFWLHYILSTGWIMEIEQLGYIGVNLNTLVFGAFSYKD